MSIRCLLVEDELFNRDVLSLTLRRSSFEVEAVDGGNAALKALQTAYFDVAIIDLHMPGVSGYDVIRTMRQHPDLKHIAIIAITANPSAISTPEAQMADAFFSKPVDIKQLVQTVIQLSGVSHS